MRIGYAEIDITPNNKIALGGFAHRTGKTSTVHSPLKLKVVTFDQVYLFVADLLWWEEELVFVWKRLLLQKGIIAIFTATHSHCSPQIHRQLCRDLGEVDEDYLYFLNERINQVIYELEYEQCEFYEIHKKETDQSSFRRKKVDGTIVMAPNVDASFDRNISKIILSDGEKERLILIHYACHPTVSDVNTISSEYCGYIVNALEQIYKIPVVFLQGFCGDIRPNLIKNHIYFRGQTADIERFGQSLVEAVLNSGQQCRGKLYVSTRVNNASFNVKLQPYYLVDRPSPRFDMESIDIITTKIDLADSLSFIFSNGEMSNSYQQAIDSFGVAYTDGMVGYIANAQQIAEGGYEGLDFIYAFGNRGPFPKTIEQQLLSIWKGWLT